PGRTVQPRCEVQDSRKLQPCEWAGRGGLGGFKRRWRDTRSRVFLVGELSKFPLPSDSSRGKCFAAFALGAPAGYGQPDSSPIPVAAEKGAQTSLPKERCRGQRLGSRLHKHPHPSTCPRLPPILTERGESPRAGPIPRMLPTEQAR
uniref:Killin, p53 regulated DNA replication inhibitor n=1 Tax=Propithecus coquereli TaxID=379532 RepID=A0A2K6FLG7_PROCO